MLVTTEPNPTNHSHLSGRATNWLGEILQSWCKESGPIKTEGNDEKLSIWDHCFILVSANVHQTPGRISISLCRHETNSK
jgi:hypothetical protein